MLGPDHLAELVQEADAGQPQQLLVRAQQPQRAERVGAPPLQPGEAALRRQGLRQHQQAVERVGQRQRGGGEEGQAQVDPAEHAADRGPGQEAEAERRPHPAEGAGAGFRRGDVGDIGVGGGEGGRRRAADDAPEQQPGQVGRHAHDQEVDAEPGQGDQQNRPAPEPVRQQPPYRTEGEAHRPRRASRTPRSSPPPALRPRPSSA